MTVAIGFGERLRRAVDAQGRLCLGIDPHGATLRAWITDCP